MRNLIIISLFLVLFISSNLYAETKKFPQVALKDIKLINLEPEYKEGIKTYLFNISSNLKNINKKSPNEFDYLIDINFMWMSFSYSFCFKIYKKKNKGFYLNNVSCTTATSLEELSDNLNRLIKNLKILNLKKNFTKNKKINLLINGKKPISKYVMLTSQSGFVFAINKSVEMDKPVGKVIKLNALQTNIDVVILSRESSLKLFKTIFINNFKIDKIYFNSTRKSQ